MTLRQLVTTIQQRLRPSAARPIGADFAANRLNLVQADWRDGGWRLRAASSLPYPMPRDVLLSSPKALVQFVDAALAQAPFQGLRVISALPPADVRILPLTVHVATGQTEAQAVGRAVSEQLGERAGQHVIDYYQVRGADMDGGERQVLVAAALKHRVLDYLTMLEHARLEPVALDIGPAAIGRLLATLHGSDVGQSVALLNFGAAKSYLTVIWGRRLMLDREIAFGEDMLAGAVAGALDLQPDTAASLLRQHGIGARPGMAVDSPHIELRRAIRAILHPACQALADELAHTQVYVASRTRGSSISRLYLNGSLARYPDIQSRIAELIDVPVHLLDPFGAFPESARDTGCDTAGEPATTSLALATGLALRGGADG